MSSSDSRTNILGRLYNAKHYGSDAHVPPKLEWKIRNQNAKKNIAEFEERMKAVRTEVFQVTGDEWVAKLGEIAAQRGMKKMVYAPTTPEGKVLKKAWDKGAACKLVEWKGDVEEYRDELFAVDASVTSSIGAIAESAAVILWPTVEEPRLLSIVPPVHFVVVEADKIYTSFQDAIKKLQWNKNMPTNALLISGPSKTADIELILQFGVHGPTDLIVFVVS